MTRPRRRRRFFFVGCGEPSTSQRGRRRLNGAGRGGGGGSLEVNMYLLGGVMTKVKVKVVGVRAGVRVLTQWYVVVVVMPVFRYVVMVLVALGRCMRAGGAIEACSSPRQRRGHDLAHSLVVYCGVVVLREVRGVVRDITRSSSSMVLI